MNWRLRYYMLDADNQTVEVDDWMQWAEWFECGNRFVGYTEITSQINVSTVFLGLDHRFTGNGPPLLFESMVFGGPLDGTIMRYSSWDDAEAGHKGLVRKAREAVGQKMDMTC